MGLNTPAVYGLYNRCVLNVQIHTWIIRNVPSDRFHYKTTINDIYGLNYLTGKEEISYL